MAADCDLVGEAMRACGGADGPRPDYVLAPTLAPLSLRATVLMLVEPGAAKDAVPLGELDSKPSAEATIVIGPEGGWSPEEVQTGISACRLVTLGRRTLRADVMAVVALAALFTKWNEL